MLDSFIERPQFPVYVNVANGQFLNYWWFKLLFDSIRA
jgi:hypothetical protein